MGSTACILEQWHAGRNKIVS